MKIVVFAIPLVVAMSIRLQRSIHTRLVYYYLSGFYLRIPFTPCVCTVPRETILRVYFHLRTHFVLHPSKCRSEAAVLPAFRLMHYCFENIRFNVDSIDASRARNFLIGWKKWNYLKCSLSPFSWDLLGGIERSLYRCMYNGKLFRQLSLIMIFPDSFFGSYTWAKHWRFRNQTMFTWTFILSSSSIHEHGDWRYVIRLPTEVDSSHSTNICLYWWTGYH